MATPTIQIGTVIYAEVCDPNGTPVGPHFCVVILPNAEIDRGDDLRVAVCTTSFGYPLKSGWFEMPSTPGSRSKLGLREATVVKATWIQSIPQSEVIRVYQRAPVRILKQIINWITNKERDAERKEGEL